MKVAFDKVVHMKKKNNKNINSKLIKRKHLTSAEGPET